MKRLLTILAVALLATFAVSAQETCAKDAKCCQAGGCCLENTFFPGWYFGGQLGVAYTSSNEWGYAGWSKFKHLNVPNLSLNAGYDFTPVFGLRGSLSGPIGNYPGPDHMSIHRFGYAQLAADAMFDICNIFRHKETRLANPYLFVGAGAFLRFATEGKPAFFGPLVRLGTGIDFRVNELIDISFELQDNALHNKFNTLTAADKGTDWDNEYHGDDGLYYGGEVLKIKKPFRWDDNVTALVGIKFNLGSVKKRAAARENCHAKAAAIAAEAEAAALAARAASRAVEERIYFDLNSAEIKESEQPKVDHLVDILKKYPEAVITISGYADKDTGTADINMALSEKRTTAVAQALEAAGIAASRITTDPMGDKIRVSEVPEENRVCICITK